MSDTIAPFVSVVLSWTRSRPGATAILRRVSPAAPTWEEIGRTTESEYRVGGLHAERSHEFAAAAVLDDGALALEAEWEILRIAPMADAGRPPLPGAPTGFAAAQEGSVLHFRWTAPADGLAASYELRVGASWENGRRIGAEISAAPWSWPWEAAVETTVFVKSIDRFGRASREAAQLIIEIRPLPSHVETDVVDEGDGGWTGTATHLEDDGGTLRLEAIPPCFGAVTAPFGSFAGVPAFARYWPTGTYETAVVNAGQIEEQRVEVDLGTTQPVDAGLPFGAVRRRALGQTRRRDGTAVPIGFRGWASRQSWRVTPLLPVDALVEIDTSDSAAGAWDGWRPWVPGTYRFWRMRLRVTVRGDGLRFTRIQRIVCRRSKFNRKLEGSVVLTGAGPIEVDLSAAGFTAAPIVVPALAANPAAASVKIVVTNVTPTSCDIEAFDGSGTSIATTVGWHALGV